jgi:hypothetical protein
MKLPDAPELIYVCQVCGRDHKRGLCAECEAEWTDPATGQLQPWLAELMRDRNRDAQRESRNQRLVTDGATPQKREGQRSRPKSWGIRIVPLGDGSELEALRDRQTVGDPLNHFPARRHGKPRAD